MTATETEQKAAAPAFLQKAQDLSHFHWNERWLPLDTLVTFRLGEAVGGFQRPLQERRVQVLVDQFDAGEARTIFVSKRDLPSGKSEYVVLDGQHTAAALKRVGMTHWYCRIFFGMTPEVREQLAQDPGCCSAQRRGHRQYHHRRGHREHPEALLPAHFDCQAAFRRGLHPHRLPGRVREAPGYLSRHSPGSHPARGRCLGP